MLTFSIYRQGQEITLDVEIGSKTESALKDEEEAEAAEEEQAPQQPEQGIQGWSDNPMEDFFRFYFGYSPDREHFSGRPDLKAETDCALRGAPDKKGLSF